MKTEITIGIDTDALDNVTDHHLVCLWAVAQANPADLGNRDAGEVTEYVGREMIRRFIALNGLPLWNNQGTSYFWNELRKVGKWVDGEFVPNVAPVMREVA